jgi:hypothetical protein
MAQQSFAGLAVLVALAFAIMALSACASSKQTVQVYGPAVVVPLEPELSAPEFHDAQIGADALRSRLESEA